MISIFRKKRKKMLAENRGVKYLKYALGEIVLVVIGILIALQINNMNEANIQEKVLNEILQNIANGVTSDLKELKLLSTARASIFVEADSIYDKFISSDEQSINLEEASYVLFAFQDITNVISFNPYLSAFESFKNSTYFAKIQGSDLALLLSTYYTSADKIKDLEVGFNQSIGRLEKNWESNFGNEARDAFRLPWESGDLAIVSPDFLEVLRDHHTTEIFKMGQREGGGLKMYQEQILLGSKLVEMIRGSETSFDEQTKVELSGVLFSFGDADLVSILINGLAPSGFEIKYAASDLFRNYFSHEKDYLVIDYPANQYEWAALYFTVNALHGRVNEMDFSPYSKVVIEMKGEQGGEIFELTMKDINDPPDGTETRLKMALTDQWKVYEIETNLFVTADLSRIMVPLSFVCQGSEGNKIQVRSIQFKKD